MSNLGLHTNHEVAKCIMSAKGDNTSFPPSFQPFGKHLMLTSHDSSAFSNMSKRPTCSSEHSVAPRSKLLEERMARLEERMARLDAARQYFPPRSGTTFFR